MPVDRTTRSSSVAPNPRGGSGRPAGKSLGDYRWLRELGRAGKAVVYEAEQVSLGRHVARKGLPFGIVKPGR